ncbi:MAG: ribosomal RNA small subunit methyltransferase A [Candidatus Aenigmarchaeota archaeon]|nr:ribosomal RNA small subunit methyltransferase A [Candidatus Aenigmarchaeota archaeon]
MKELSNIKANIKLDQHFLKNRKYMDIELEAANIQKNEVILEIGPGPGIITKELLNLSKKVVAVEYDWRFVVHIKETFPDVELIKGDAVKVEFPKFDKCVSNLPYSISSPIIMKLGKLGKFAVLMLQKEFALRLVAVPGDKNYSRLSLMANYFFVPEYIVSVPRTAFSPKPKVESAIVRLVPRTDRPKPKDEDLFFKVAEALFIHKNQNTKKSFYNSRHYFDMDKETAKKFVLDIPHSDKKVKTLNIENVVKIADWVYNGLK